MLKNYKLLLDQNCPMCVFYGKLFIKFRLIDSSVIAPYQTFNFTPLDHIDANKATKEIALYNTINNTTEYGVDTFLHILFHQYTWFINLLRLPVIYQILQFVYAFVSFNRKIFYPVNNCSAQGCNPELNLFYRWSYILLVGFITGTILGTYMASIYQEFGLNVPFRTEFAICFGQILWQLIPILIIRKSETHDYIGNMSTVSLIGGILLLPMIGLSYWLTIGPIIFLIYFGIVVLIMLLEHHRRCRLMGLPVTLTLSWVTYRSVVLIILLFLNQTL